MSRARLVTLEREDSQADVLVVTNSWPDAERPVYGIPVKRQIDAVVDAGARCDVLFVRGSRSPLAYVAGALLLASWSVTRRRRYRLVHVHGGETFFAAAWRRGTPMLVTYLGSDVLGSPRADGTMALEWRIRRRLVRLTSLLATQVITESREMQELLPARVRRRSIVLAKGVDSEVFRPLDRADARRRLGWPLETRVALFAADPDVSIKRFWLAEAAVQAVQPLLPDVELRVASGIAPDRLPLYMNAADCLLHTSSSEGSPNVVKEALMCNLPVVATPAGDIPDLLAGVEPSYVCEPSASSLAAALRECLETLRRSNGRSRSARLDSRAVAASLLAIYADLGGS